MTSERELREMRRRVQAEVDRLSTSELNVLHRSTIAFEGWVQRTARTLARFLMLPFRAISSAIRGVWQAIFGP